MGDMSTVITLHPGVVNKTISNTVKALAAGQGITVEEAGRRAGISRSTMFKRVKGTNAWTAEEVAQLASALDATVRELYSGMDGRFVPAFAASSRAFAASSGEIFSSARRNSSGSTGASLSGMGPSVGTEAIRHAVRKSVHDRAPKIKFCATVPAKRRAPVAAGALRLFKLVTGRPGESA